MKQSETEIIYSQSSTIKGHLSLKRYNALFFFSLIVDEKAEHKTDDVVMSICKKFNVTYNENYGSIDSNLSNFLIKSKGINEISTVHWQAEIEGIVEIMYEAIEYTYISTEGIKYLYRWDESSYLIVNEKIIENDCWNLEKIEIFISEIETLFSIYNTAIKKDYYIIFDIAWNRFEKGDKWKARDQMTHASCMIHGHVPENGSVEYFDVLYNGYVFIAKKWFLYLWECKERKMQEDYILSLKSFISKNQDSWTQGGNHHIALNKIYTIEHEEIKKSFLRESEVLYKSIWELTE